MQLTTQRTLVLTFTVAALLTGIADQSRADHSRADKAAMYEFDIFRNGSPVGEHRLEIARVQDQTHVMARSNIQVSFLGFTVYRMRYQAEEVWDRNGLKALTVAVDDDGDVQRIDGRRHGTEFEWTTADGRTQRKTLPVYPTNHWNPSVLQAGTVLNTLTGNPNRIEVVGDPTAAALPLPTQAGVPVSGFEYRGDLNLHSWYDGRGRWLGMRFEGSDGSQIEYVCRNCGDVVTL